MIRQEVTDLMKYYLIRRIIIKEMVYLVLFTASVLISTSGQGKGVFLTSMKSRKKKYKRSNVS